jgi:hypothetical protein
MKDRRITTSYIVTSARFAMDDCGHHHRTREGAERCRRNLTAADDLGLYSAYWKGARVRKIVRTFFEGSWDWRYAR